MRRQAKALFVTAALVAFFSLPAAAFADALPPTLAIDAPTEVRYQTAHVSGTINPEGGDSTIFWRFEYSTNPSDPSSWTWSSAIGEISGDEAGALSPLEVEGDITELTPATEYAVRLVAERPESGERVESPLPNPTFTTLPLGPPSIVQVVATPFTTEAELVAKIATGGLQTTYYFEYGPTSAYGNATAVKTLPAGGTIASANIKSLTPGTTYHYRLIVENADGSAESGDRSFTESFDAGAALPNGRAYELVSNEASNLDEVLRAVSADEGSAAAYLTNAGLDSSRAAFLYPAWTASRNPLRWATEPLQALPSSVTAGVLRVMQPEAFSSDLKKGAIYTWAALDPDDQNADGDLYLVDSSTGTAIWVSEPPSGHATEGGPSGYKFAGASRDLSRIYFHQRGPVPLIPGSPGFSMYEWHEGTVELVSRRPNGEPYGSEMAVDPHQFSPYYSTDEGIAAPHGGAHQASDDGSTFFYLLEGAVHAWKDGEPIGVSLSQKAGSEGEPCLSNFIGATRSGDLAYFECREELTDSATEGGGIYSYRLSTGELKLVTPDAGSPGGLGISSALMSDDASHVYFVTTAALAPAAVEGEPNLYVFSGGETRFIAAVPLGTKIARSSRSGRYAVLESTGSIGGATNAGHLALYRYDDQEGEILCVSCRSDGNASTGDANLNDRVSTGIGALRSAPRNIDDHGNVFFASSDRIVPEDLTAAWDVYEYTEGAPHLLSTGRSQYDSFVADNSDDGTDAFLLTGAALVRSDQDAGLTDLYDARVGGGLPEAEAEAHECVEDGCQGSISPLPKASAPGTRDLRSEGRHGRRYRLISIRSKGAMLVVRVNGPGRLSIRGHGLLPQARVVKKAGIARARLRLKPPAKKLLREKGQMAVQVSVRFQPSRGAPSSAKTTVRFRR